MALHPDQPDYSVPALGPISKESRLSWHSQLSNHGAAAVFRKVTGDYREGKFFPRGCRGFISTIDVYSFAGPFNDDTLRVYISPQPGIGPTYTADITVLAATGAAWRSAIFNKMWNYDSLFVWMVAIDDFCAWAYDDGAPYDFYTWMPGCGEFVTQATCEAAGCEWEIDTCHCCWNSGNYRLWIRVNFTGETAGDVPVSGTINTIPIPSRSDERLTGSVSLSDVGETTLRTIHGAGTVEFIEFKTGAAVQSDRTHLRVYCDDVLSWYYDFFSLNARGYTTSTPRMSLSKYADDGLCVVLLTLRFSFKRELRLTAGLLAGPVAARTVTTDGLVNLIR